MDGDSSESMLFIRCQRYNLKANHNRISIPAVRKLVVYKMSKIQFKSKSQLNRSCCYVFRVVYKMSKIQFKSKSQQADGTTPLLKVVYKMSKIQFKSKSQLI